MASHAAETGSWSEKISWELFVGEKDLPTELITAVFCVAITTDQKIVLARSERGWGLLGGHIEPNETVDEALMRESIEEGGFTPANPQMFAYRKVTASEPLPHQDPTKQYPFPISYLTYYWATTDSQIIAPSGIEIIESASFGIEEVRSLGTRDLSIIEAGYKAFLGQA